MGSFVIQVGLSSSKAAIVVVSTIPTNHTVDDAGPVVEYLGSVFQACPLTGAQPWNTTQLLNGTPASTTIEPGVAEFFVDGVPWNGSATSTAEYNILAYQHSDMPEGPHAFRMGVTRLGGGLNFDCAIYTSNDPDPTSISSASSSTSGGPIPSTMSAKPRKKRSVAAITGGVAGGVAAFLGLLLWRRSQRRKNGSAFVMEQRAETRQNAMPPRLVPLPARARANDLAVPEDKNTPEVAAKLRILKEQVQRLECRVEGSGNSSAGFDTASMSRGTTSLRRGLSTMKRISVEAAVSDDFGCSHLAVMRQRCQRCAMAKSSEYAQRR
ncbi:hypothetical protein C8R44DRAFT_858029 [Mycena epipterygia]|nr:hypothetical protein C8R44DRAFT_858029 [Mycena epipterygia]